MGSASLRISYAASDQIDAFFPCREIKCPHPCKRKEKIVLIDLWHHWLLLRPLLVFALAGPLLVFALLFRGHGQPRRSEGKTHDDGAPTSLRTITEGRPEPEPD